MLNIEDVLDILSTPLLGIIPESKAVLHASNAGSPVMMFNAETHAEGNAAHSDGRGPAQQWRQK